MSLLNVGNETKKTSGEVLAATTGRPALAAAKSDSGPGTAARAHPFQSKPVVPAPPDWVRPIGRMDTIAPSPSVEVCNNTTSITGSGAAVSGNTNVAQFVPDTRSPSLTGWTSDRLASSGPSTITPLSTAQTPLLITNATDNLPLSWTTSSGPPTATSHLNPDLLNLDAHCAVDALAHSSSNTIPLPTLNTLPTRPFTLVNPPRLNPRPKFRLGPLAMPGRPNSGTGNTNIGPNTPGSNSKRSAEDEVSIHDGAAASTSKMKLPRLDRPGGSHGPEDFSSVVKNRLQSYTRTGQACDRCKVRKIRCDALPDGCSHCINLNLECYVTDRVTGRTERRGYMQELEREKNGMMSHIRDLEKLLSGKGIQVKTYSGAAWVDVPPGSTLDQSGNIVQGPPSLENEDWDRFASLWIKDDGRSPVPTTGHVNGPPYLMHNFPRSQLPSRPEDSNLMVGWDSKPLSSIQGTKLTIMGTTIDTVSFAAPDMDEPPSDTATPLYNKSVQAFLQSAMGVNPPMHIELPPREDAFTYAEWYFLIMSAYFPVIHKPTFTRLLERIYEEPNFQPPVADLVMVHMVFAIIYYQYGVRNWAEVERRNHLNDLSNKHYHFCLSKFFDLMASGDLSAVQALTLIAAHTRAFPKPGCGALISNLAFQRALELNLHREPKMPKSGTNLSIEMRKRTWWVLLSVCVASTGRRGRPLPIAVEEFDVGFPEAIADELLTEDGVDRSQPDIECSFEVGLATFKIIPIMMEMYSNLYSVRRDAANYTKVVFALEKQLRLWEEMLPEKFKVDRQQTPDPTQPQHMLAPLYLRLFSLEIQLWLRHNSVNPINDKKMMADNTRICEETARQLLHTVQHVIELKSLDTTWTQASIFAMSLFSMLVAHWERRFETTPDQVAVLRREMNEWLAVLDELSQLMASGPGIRNEISRIVDRTIAWIERDMHSQRPKHLQQQHSDSNTPVRLKKEQAEVAMQQLPPRPATTPAQPQTQSDGTKVYYQGGGINGHSQQTAYPPLPYGNHPQANTLGAPPYETEAAMFYGNPNHHTAAAAPVASGVEGHNNPLAFAPQAGQHVDPDGMMWRGGNTWTDWTAAIADSDRYGGAGALMNLGAGTTPTPRAPIGGQAMEAHTAGAHDGSAQWPLVIFDHPQQSHQPHHHPHLQAPPQHHISHHHGASGV